jgi:branched-subunit amino acid transport protein
MLTALVLPMVVASPGEDLSASAPKIVAAVLACVVAFFTRSTLKTLSAGMLALWALQFAARGIG